MSLFFPLSFLLVCSFLVVLPLVDSPSIVGVDMVVLAVGALVYFGLVRSNPCGGQSKAAEWNCEFLLK